MSFFEWSESTSSVYGQGTLGLSTIGRTLDIPDEPEQVDTFERA